MCGRQAGAGVEIDDAMVDAAADELCTYDPEYEGPAEAARRILGAALGREVVSPHESRHVRANLPDFFGNLGKLINRHWFVDNS